MKYLILISFLFVSTTAFSRANIKGSECNNAPQIIPVHPRIKLPIIHKGKEISEYEYAHHFCREHKCVRAYDLKIQDSGSPGTGLIQHITSVRCQNDTYNANLFSPINLFDLFESLDSSYNRLRRNHILAPLEVIPKTGSSHTTQETSGSLDGN